jgi:transcriptional regulator with XRE-family HTH domain
MHGGEMTDFLERLKYLMARDAIKTQYQLAKKIGVKNAIISNWFRQRARYPSEENLIKLADLFRVHPSWLKYGEKQFKPKLTDEAMKVAEKLKYSTPEIIAKVSRIIDILSEPILKPQTCVYYRADAKTYQTQYISENLEEFFGYTVKEWLEDPDFWEKSIHPSDKQRVIDKLKEAQHNGTNIALKYRLMKKNGTFIDIEDHVAWERDFKGNIVSVKGFICSLEKGNLVCELNKTEINDKS